MHTDPPNFHPTDAAAALHVCARCASELVQPVAWEPSGDSGWRILLRCPECEWSTTGVHSDADCARFDEELDRGIDVLVDALDDLAVANMEAEIARFADALESGLILPEDF